MSSISSVGAVNPMLMERSALDGIASKKALIANLDKVVTLLIDGKLSMSELLAIDALIIENFPFAKKDTPLPQLLFFVAVDVKNSNVVRDLIEVDSVDVNQMNKAGQTPLQCACVRSDIGLVETLLLAGADVELAGSDKMTPLLLASKQGHAEIVQLLVSAPYKANIHHIDAEGNTALQLAAFGDNLATLSILLKAGSDPLTFGRHPDGRSAFHIACWADKPLFVEKMLLFMQEKDLPHFGGIESENLPVNYGQLPKPIPVLRKPDLKTVAIDLKRGLNLVQSNPLSRSSSAFKLPLFASISQLRNPIPSPTENSLFDTEVLSSPREVNKRQRIGADLTKPAQSIVRVDSVSESSPLVSVPSSFPSQSVVQANDKSESSSQASVYQSLEVRNLLDQPTSSGLTGLQLAANYGHFSVCQTLLRFGANEDLLTTDGRLFTPLLGACYGKFVTVAKLLIDHKKAKSPEALASFINAADSGGETPFSSAFFWEQSDLILYLLEHKAIINPEILLIQNTPENEQQGKTTLHVAVSIGIPEIVESLLQYLKLNAPKSLAEYINATDRQGKCAMDSAVAKKNFLIVEILLKYGATHSADNFSSLLSAVSQESCRRDNTIVHIVVSLGLPKLLEALLQYTKLNYPGSLDSFINSNDGEGNCALFKAMATNHYSVAEVLLKYDATIPPALVHFAVSERRFKWAQLLTGKSVMAVDAKDANGFTLLINALLGELPTDPLILHLLLQSRYGATLDTHDDHGMAPLHYAARKGDLLACKILLSYGAYVDSLTLEGNGIRRTSMRIAESANVPAIVEELQRHKKEKSPVNLEQYTPRKTTSMNNRALWKATRT